MKKAIIPAVIIVAFILLNGCAKGISTYQAANGMAKCGRHIR